MSYVFERHPLPWKPQMDRHLGYFSYIYDANGERVPVDDHDIAYLIVEAVNERHVPAPEEPSDA